MQAPLTNTEVWRLTQLLYTLYNDIIECSDQIEFEVIDNPDIPGALSIVGINERINSYQNNPPSLPVEDGLSLPLDRTNLQRLRSHIIDNNNINLALDIIDPYLDIQGIADYISTALGAVQPSTTCIDYLTFIDFFIDDIRAWTEIRLNQLGSSLDQALESKKHSGFVIFQQHLKRYHQLLNKTTAATNPLKYKSASDLSHIFAKNLPPKLIINIYQTLSAINHEKSEGYTTLIAAIIAEAHKRKYISITFSAAIEAIYTHFGIREETKHLRPARLNNPNHKGTAPEAHKKAVEILENLTLQN